MNLGINTELVFNGDGKKVFIDEKNDLQFVYFFDELSIKSKFIAVQELIYDSKAFEFEEGPSSIVDAYESLKNDVSNLFNVDGIVLSHGGGYIC